MAIQNQPDLARQTRFSLLQAGGFTMIELIVVAAIIGLLAGLVIGTAGYVKRKADSGRVRSEMAGMENALESYKIDQGTYPVSTGYRVSTTGITELSNSIALYQAIGGVNGKAYYRFRPDQVKTNSIYGTFTNNTIYAVDPWGSPYNYIRMAKVVAIPNAGSLNYYGLINSGALPPFGVTSGQVNTTTFDLWSYGPDRVTPVPYGNPGWPWNAMCVTPSCYSFAVDDIVNWR